MSISIISFESPLIDNLFQIVDQLTISPIDKSDFKNLFLYYFNDLLPVSFLLEESYEGFLMSRFNPPFLNSEEKKIFACVKKAFERIQEIKRINEQRHDEYLIAQIAQAFLYNPETLVITPKDISYDFSLEEFMIETDKYQESPSPLSITEQY
ncbi:MAG: hypothetical protein K1060chlam5_00967 [Candidatus Anoxychlamydiales bacterium]|nr:hypothetical protein [Candidatus Anoxychlamydiales bacterium]